MKWKSLLKPVEPLLLLSTYIYSLSQSPPSGSEEIKGNWFPGLSFSDRQTVLAWFFFSLARAWGYCTCDGLGKTWVFTHGWQQDRTGRSRV
ncbi:hypothetical protein F5Y11DRAFT_4202 [Daldinia sp. FL1419]|nr:hypothetical protein F5Y11DRAFT_4202 [Daldinia sp. FL1419]